MQSIRIVVSAVTVLCASGAARAGPVTWQFTGQVTEFGDLNDSLGGSVHVGTPFSGEFTFESTTQDSEPDDPTSGIYEDVLLSLSGEVGDIEFSFDPTSWSWMHVVDDDPYTRDDHLALRTMVSLLGGAVSFGFGFSDSNGGVFSSDALPLAVPALSLLDTHGFGLWSQERGLSLNGEVTSLVPEPAVITFILFGSFALLRRRACCRVSRRSAATARQSVRVVVSAAAVLYASGAARAGPVTWYFAGNVTEVHDEYTLLGGSVHVGTPFSGEFTFESTTPDSEPDDPTSGSYEPGRGRGTRPAVRGHSSASTVRQRSRCSVLLARPQKVRPRTHPTVLRLTTAQLRWILPSIEHRRTSRQCHQVVSPISGKEVGHPALQKRGGTDKLIASAVP